MTTFILHGGAPRREEESVVLSEQLKNADVIYLRGGSTPALKAVLGEIRDLVDLVKGKIVVGSSAGAYVLSKYYYTHERDCIDKGLGILPIKTMCHYVEDRADKLRDLKEFVEDLPVYPISSPPNVSVFVIVYTEKPNSNF